MKPVPLVLTLVWLVASDVPLAGQQPRFTPTAISKAVRVASMIEPTASRPSDPADGLTGGRPGAPRQRGVVPSGQKFTGRTPRRMTSNDQGVIVRRRDSLWNGILIGLGAGALGGYLVAKTTCTTDPECQVYNMMAIVPIGAGIGAAVGALIDYSR